MSVIDYQQRTGRDRDIILEALNSYREWMLDDDFDADACLARIMNRMDERLRMTASEDAPAALASRLAEVEAERDELQAALDSEHAEVGSNIWRFWRDEARRFAKQADRADRLAREVERKDELLKDAWKAFRAIQDEGCPRSNGIATRLLDKLEALASEQGEA